MLKIEFAIDSEEFPRHTDDFIARVIKPALAAGVNSAAVLVHADLIEAAADTFDRPVAFTMQGFKVLYASTSFGGRTNGSM
jgi:hypothetical protein